MDSVYCHIEHDPQIFVDSLLIECTQGLTRRWHKPVRDEPGPLISADRLWEQMLYFTYSTHYVIKDPDDGLVKCWYEDLGPTDGQGHPKKTRLLYAVSKDGVEFHKPKLDHCIIDGQRTNIIAGYVEGGNPTERNPWANAGVHCNGIVIDPYPPTPEERFRSIFTRYRFEGTNPTGTQTECAHSPDGLHWIPYELSPTMGSSGSQLDDVSCLHYDSEARQFVQNTRHGLMYKAAQNPKTPRVSNWFGPYYPHRPDLMNKRRIYQTRSHDFLHWTNPIAVSIPDDELDNLDEAHYGMQQFRVGRIHFATLGVFRYVDNEMEVRLLLSRDGVNFKPADRGQPFLAPRGKTYWDAHMVSMTSQPIEMGDEWWFYHGGTSAHHDWWIGPPEGIDEPEVHDPGEHVRFGLGLSRLRKEGIASLDASRQRDGYVITRPVMSVGEGLVINARCREGGSIRAAVLDIEGEPIGNCSLPAVDVFTGDSTSHMVTWSGNPTLPAKDQWRKLHFLLRNAEIYSFRLASAG